MIRLLLLFTTGCVGLGGSVQGGASVSTRGHVRLGVGGLAGVHTRTSTAASDDQRQALAAFGVAAQGSYLPTAATDRFALAAGFSGGFDRFEGASAVVGLLTFGGWGSGSRSGVWIRAQLGWQRELGGSDWRIDEIIEPCGGVETRTVRRDRSHGFVAILPGIELWIGSGIEAAISLSGALRGMTELTYGC